ncbi:unnamed protein product [Tilletia controversa]|nr:unnamed protein product [Tilletia controversa]
MPPAHAYSLTLLCSALLSSLLLSSSPCTRGAPVPPLLLPPAPSPLLVKELFTSQHCAPRPQDLKTDARARPYHNAFKLNTGGS